MTLTSIILGGLLPLAVAYSLGKLCFPQAPDVIALGTGAAIESHADYLGSCSLSTESFTSFTRCPGDPS